METMRKAGKISNIRLLYHSLSEQIIADNLASLKFLCGDYLTPVRLEKIDNAKQLLSAIGEVVESESEQLELLKELFEKIGRRDLKSKVKEFQQSRKGRLLYSLKNMINYQLVSTSLRSWRYCVGARLKFRRRSRVPKKGSRDEAVEIPPARKPQ